MERNGARRCELEKEKPEEEGRSNDSIELCGVCDGLFEGVCFFEKSGNAGIVDCVGGRGQKHEEAEKKRGEGGFGEKSELRTAENQTVELEDGRKCIIFAESGNPFESYAVHVPLKRILQEKIHVILGMEQQRILQAFAVKPIQHCDQLFGNLWEQ